MNYINTYKKVFVNSVNMPLKQKLSVDYATDPIMKIALLTKEGKPFEIPETAVFYMAGDTDYNQGSAPCFYSTSYTVEGNILTFEIDTYTEEFFSKIKNPDSSLIVELGMKADGKASVLLQDEILAQPRVYIEGKPAPSVSEKYYTAGEVDLIFQNYATEGYVDEKIENIDFPEPDFSGLATEDYVDEKIAEIDVPSVAGLATEGYVDEKIAEIEIPSITGLATENYVDEKITIVNKSLSTKADKSEIPSVAGLASEKYVDEKIAEIDVPEADLTGYATEKYVDNQITIVNTSLNTKADKSEIPSINGLATEGYVNNQITVVNNALTNKADKSEIPSLEGYATESYVDEAVKNAGGGGGGGGSADLSNYTGGVSITGEVNGSTADILNYAKTANSFGTITVGWNNPSFVAQPNADTYNNNLFVKGWMLGIIGGYQVLLNAGGQTITLNKSTGINLDANNLLWRGTGLNYGNGLCLLNYNGNLPSYVTSPYINKSDTYGDVWFRFNSDSQLDWYSNYSNALTFYDDGDFWFDYPDGLTKRMEDNCITKEIWITSTEEITTISIPEYVQVIGEMPSSLEPTAEIMYNGSSYNRQLTHVFVVRGINYNGKWIYTINYSYNFISNYNGIFD